MIELGKINSLEVSRIGPYGTYLDGGEAGEVLLLRSRSVESPEHRRTGSSSAQAPLSVPRKESKVGDKLTVFVYIDSDDTLVASINQPLVVADECAALKVVALTDHGAFLDWGLSSDLFVPRSEQLGDMSIGSVCVVLAMLDEISQRMIASAKLYHYLPDEDNGTFKPGQKVKLLVCQQTDLGYKAVIAGTHLGMIFQNEVFTDLKIGDVRDGYIKAVREDGKIDLLLQKSGAAARDDLEAQVLAYLKDNNGTSTLTDKSPPQEIYNTFGVSKKAYKKALGGLYRNRLIVLSKDKVELV
jgi:predicted RNA-binding protein (virulence factor B family)